MAVEVKHPFVCDIPDDPASQAAGEVMPSHWNTAHALTQNGSALVGKPTAGAGASVEVPLGAGIGFAAGALINTDAGSSAVASHIAAADPHPFYLTQAEGDASYQPFDADLTALAALNAVPGLVEQTGSAAFTKRPIGVGTAASIPTTGDADSRFAAIGHTHAALTPAGGTAGQVLTKNTATNFDYSWQTPAGGGGGMLDPGANGFVVRTTLNTTVSRIIVLGSSKLSGSNLDGVAANPTIDVVEANLSLPNFGGLLPNAKLASMAAGTFKGNNTGVAASPIDLTATQVKTALGIVPADVVGLGALATQSSVNLATQSNGILPVTSLPALIGDVTSTVGSSATTIGVNTVSNSKIAQSPANTIKGNNTGATANVADLNAAQVKALLAIAAADVSGLGALATQGSVNLSTQATGVLQAAQEPAHTGDVTNTAGSLALTIAANAVTNAKAAQMPANTIKGNNTGAPANSADLTTAQVTAILDLFSTTLKGLVPASGGGTANFLRADGTWSAPPAVGGISSADIQVFTASGTWTKPAGAKVVDAVVIGGGAGGGSGRKGATATVRCGGGGGASGAISTQTFAASALGATEAITVGAGGPGGAAVTVNSTNGNTGTSGGVSSFGAKLRTNASTGGGGGTATLGVGGTAGSGLPHTGTNGAAASTTGLAGSAPANSTSGASGAGGSGGGISAANAVSAGGAGGSVNNVYANGANIGGAAGTATPTAGGAGTADAATNLGGGGGGGGSSQTAVAAGNGGNGANFGAGGGGGGAALDTTTPQSGAGGNGAPGVVIVITYF